MQRECAKAAISNYIIKLKECENKLKKGNGIINLTKKRKRNS